MGTPSLMHPRDFLDGGYLHEVNRLLLHPLGLALQVTPIPFADGHFKAAVWDCREEREGIYYDPSTITPEKALAVAKQMFERKPGRRAELGYVIQPIETDKPTLTTTYINPKERRRA